MTNKHHQPRYISTPPVRWTNFCEIVFTKKITMILFVLIFVTLIQNSVALRARSGHTNPWGENQRPKLYTDYLTKHSGKTIFLYFFFILKKKHEKKIDITATWAGYTRTNSLRIHIFLAKLVRIVPNNKRVT